MDEVNRKLKEKAEELEKEAIILKEGKRSKLGFPELGLFIKSKKMDEKTRICPVEGCLEAFKMSRSCDSHVNNHLGYEYGPCRKCGYTNIHLDSLEKHQCFSKLEERRG